MFILKCNNRPRSCEEKAGRDAAAARGGSEQPCRGPGHGGARGRGGGGGGGGGGRGGGEGAAGSGAAAA